MGLFSGIKKAFKRITKAVRSVERSVLGNDLVKTLDPALYYTNQSIQKNVQFAETLLTGGPKQAFDSGPVSAVSDVAVDRAKDLKRTEARKKRQGVGAGATLLTDGATQPLGGQSSMGPG